MVDFYDKYSTFVKISDNSDNSLLWDSSTTGGLISTLYYGSVSFVVNTKNELDTHTSDPTGTLAYVINGAGNGIYRYVNSIWELLLVIPLINDAKFINLDDQSLRIYNSRTNTWDIYKNAIKSLTTPLNSAIGIDNTDPLNPVIDLIRDPYYNPAIYSVVWNNSTYPNKTLIKGINLTSDPGHVTKVNYINLDGEIFDVTNITVGTDAGGNEIITTNDNLKDGTKLGIRVSVDKTSFNGRRMFSEFYYFVEQINSDWNATEGAAFILNKPTDLVHDVNYVHTDNNYTTIEKTKLSNISDGAEVNVQSNWSVSDTSSDAFILNKPTIPAAANNATITVHQDGIATDQSFTVDQVSNMTINLNDTVSNVPDPEFPEGNNYVLTYNGSEYVWVVAASTGGKYLGSVNTYDELPINTTDLNNLWPGAKVEDYAIVQHDSNNGNKTAFYIILSIVGTTVTWDLMYFIDNDILPDEKYVKELDVDPGSVVGDKAGEIVITKHRKNLKTSAETSKTTTLKHNEDIDFTVGGTVQNPEVTLSSKINPSINNKLIRTNAGLFVGEEDEPSFIIWMATTGSDTTGTGTEDNPYATLSKCLTVVGLQDENVYCRIDIKAGDYTSLPFETTHRCDIIGHGNVRLHDNTSGTGDNIVRINQNKPHINIENCIFQMNRGAWRVNMNFYNITFTNCIFEIDITGGSASMDVGIGFENCVLYDCNGLYESVTNHFGGWNSGIGFSESELFDSTFINNCDGFNGDHDKNTPTGTYLIDSEATNCTFQSSRVFDCTISSGDGYPCIEPSPYPRSWALQIGVRILNGDTTGFRSGTSSTITDCTFDGLVLNNGELKLYGDNTLEINSNVIATLPSFKHRYLVEWINPTNIDNVNMNSEKAIIYNPGGVLYNKPRYVSHCFGYYSHDKITTDIYLNSDTGDDYENYGDSITDPWQTMERFMRWLREEYTETNDFLVVHLAGNNNFERAIVDNIYDIAFINDSGSPVSIECITSDFKMNYAHNIYHINLTYLNTDLLVNDPVIKIDNSMNITFNDCSFETTVGNTIWFRINNSDVKFNDITVEGHSLSSKFIINTELPGTIHVSGLNTMNNIATICDGKDSLFYFEEQVVGTGGSNSVLNPTWTVGAYNIPINTTIIILKKYRTESDGNEYINIVTSDTVPTNKLNVYNRDLGDDITGTWNTIATTNYEFTPAAGVILPENWDVSYIE